METVRRNLAELNNRKLIICFSFGASSLLAVVPKDVLALKTDEESLRSFSPRSSRLATPSGTAESHVFYSYIIR